MANLLFSKPKHQPNKSRSGYDVSSRAIFTASPGMLLPTYYDFANPGESYKLNSASFIRTEPLESAAFVRIKAHVDWFFVPVTQLYSLWNEFYNMTDDVMSSIFSVSSVKSTLPEINHANLPLASSPSTSYDSRMSYFVQNYSGSSVYVLKVDEFGVPLAWNARRLFDMLFGIQNLENPNMNWYALPLLAYHKCFHSHYRNTDYTRNDPTSYNVDKFYSVADSDPDHFAKLLKIHYRKWRPDLCNALQPAPTFGNGFASFLPNSILKESSNFPFPELTDYFPERSGEANIAASGTQINFSDSSFEYPIIVPSLRNIDGNGAFSAGDIRAMFALDKLLRVTASTGSHYDEQTLAHFGYKMPQGISDEAYYLGEQITDININEVVATATTGAKGDEGQDVAGATIGDIAGKGFGSSQRSKDISFTCPSHGFIMAIFSIEPIADYRAEGDITQYYKTSFDFYHEEFDNIGMQPFMYWGSQYTGSSLPGWQYRYINHKTKVDVAFESIYSTNKASWSASRPGASMLSVGLNSRFYIYPQYLNGVFLQSVPTYRTPPVVAPGPEDDEYYAVFTDTDTGGFAQGYGRMVDPNKIYSYDNFICVVDHKAYKTSIMSPRSLPNM
ncbi:major capsid protein [Microvirus mar58]|uniref:Major capsid protein n=1 Tax=Microvirus mar58 TaxID=2851194 RepID=A0A8F5MJ62_9VIRU|nr:major capsid protein [Microvirus mar58]